MPRDWGRKCVDEHAVQNFDIKSGMGKWIPSFPYNDLPLYRAPQILISVGGEVSGAKKQFKGKA